MDAIAAWPGGADRRPPLDVVLQGRSLEKLDLRRRAMPRAPPHVRDGRPGDHRHVPGPGARGRCRSCSSRHASAVSTRASSTRRSPGHSACRARRPWAPAGSPTRSAPCPPGFHLGRVIASCPQALVINLTNPAGIVQRAADGGLARSSDRLGVRRTDHLHVHRRRPARPPGRGDRPPVRRDEPLRLVRPRGPRRPRPSGRPRGRYGPRRRRGPRGPAHPVPALLRRPGRQLEAQRGRVSRAEQLKSIDAALLGAYASGLAGDRPKRGAVWYRLVVTPLLDGWIHGPEEPMILGVRNSGRLPEAPDGTMIEVAHRVRPRRLEPLEPPSRPALPALLLARHGAYETLVAASLEPGAAPGARLRALLANPMVSGWSQATGLLAAIDARSPGGSMPAEPGLSESRRMT